MRSKYVWGVNQVSFQTWEFLSFSRHLINSELKYLFLHISSDWIFYCYGDYIWELQRTEHTAWLGDQHMQNFGGETAGKMKTIGWNQRVNWL